MSFTANIPASGQSLGSSRLQVLNNFANYNTVVSVDHVAPNASGQGEHAKVTLNTFGSASYTVSGSKSYISSYSASAAGSQLVYQPSIVNFFVPATPRSLARITKTVAGNPGTYVLGNGPYGASTNFNASTPTGVSGAVFTYNFTNALTTADYFVFAMSEGSFVVQTVSDKTVNGFNLSVNNVNFTGSLTIMVF